MPFLAAGGATLLGAGAGTASAIGMGAGALGALAGSQGNNQSQGYNINASLSPQGQYAQGTSTSLYQDMVDSLRQSYPYTQGAQGGLAQMLQQYAQGGGLPNQGQIGFANQYAQNIFAPQQAQLDNTFYNAQQDTNRQAALLGRPVNDPILQAKLAQYKGQQQQVLGGQQTSLASQLALSLPGQQLGYQQQLAQMALGNQTAAIGQGLNILSNQQGWAKGTASVNQTGNSGGGFAGALSGGLAGFGGGLDAFNTLRNFGRPPSNTNGSFFSAGQNQGFAGSNFNGPVASNLFYDPNRG